MQQNSSHGPVKVSIPKHVALLTMGKSEWAQKNEVSIAEAYNKSFDNVKYFIQNCISLNIPILSFHLFTVKAREMSQFEHIMEAVVKNIEKLAEDQFIHDNRVKIVVIGKWYNLPGSVVEAVRKLIDATKDYDQFYVNLCVNYDGQEEIIDAIKIIARQIKAEKLDVDNIDKEIVKENLYASYFPPPNLLITNHRSKSTRGLLMWDSPRTHVYHCEKLWPDVDIGDLKAAIEDYQKYK